jgi:Ca2+-binding RTX toxin-like protein
VGTLAAHVVRGRHRGDRDGARPTVGASRTVVVGCTIAGTARSETLVGGRGDDVICGLGGHDRLVGGRGDDRLYGGPGFDATFGGPGRDRCEAELRFSCEATP